MAFFHEFVGCFKDWPSLWRMVEHFRQAKKECVIVSQHITELYFSWYGIMKQLENDYSNSRKRWKVYNVVFSFATPFFATHSICTIKHTKYDVFKSYLLSFKKQLQSDHDFVLSSFHLNLEYQEKIFSPSYCPTNSKLKTLQSIPCEMSSHLRQDKGKRTECHVFRSNFRSYNKSS